MWGSPSASVGPVGSGSSYVCHKVLCESATLLQWGVFYIRVKVRLAHFCVCVFVCLCVRACVCVYSVGASLEVPNLLIMINSCWMLVSCFTLECLADLIFGFFKKKYIYYNIWKWKQPLYVHIGYFLVWFVFSFFFVFFWSYTLYLTSLGRFQTHFISINRCKFSFPFFFGKRGGVWVKGVVFTAHQRR